MATEKRLADMRDYSMAVGKQVRQKSNRKRDVSARSIPFRFCRRRRFSVRSLCRFFRAYRYFLKTTVLLRNNQTSKGGETMAVFRGERNKGYAVMSKHHLQNRELSLKAKVQFSQMMSLPKDWDYTLLLRLETPLDFSLIIRYHKNESIFGFEREWFYAASIKRRSF